MTKRPDATHQALTLGIAAGLLLQACSRPGPPAEKAAGTQPEVEAAQADSAPAFVNKLWKVSRSSPTLGRWEYNADTVTLVEEGIRHPATVERILPDTFAITLRGGGTPLDITFIREPAP